MLVHAQTYPFLWYNNSGTYTVTFYGAFDDTTGGDVGIQGYCASPSEPTSGRAVVNGQAVLARMTAPSLNVVGAGFSVYDTGDASCSVTGRSWTIADGAGFYLIKEVYTGVTLTSGDQYGASFDLYCQSWVNVGSTVNSGSYSNSGCEINCPPLKCATGTDVWFEMDSIVIS